VQKVTLRIINAGLLYSGLLFSASTNCLCITQAKLKLRRGFVCIPLFMPINTVTGTHFERAGVELNIKMTADFCHEFAAMFLKCTGYSSIYYLKNQKN
jgi:hypothetical protein